MIEPNPLQIIARNWYGGLTDNRAKKLDRLWRQFLAALKPVQRNLFEEQR